MIDKVLIDAVSRSGLNVIIEVGGWETLLAYVAAGQSVALAPASTIAERSESFLQAPLRGLENVIVQLIRLQTPEIPGSPSLIDRLSDRLHQYAAISEDKSL